MVENLLVVEEELRMTRADLKVVEKDNLHFTVRFLGEVSEDTVKEVDRRLRGLALSSFDVTVQGVGAFPDLRRPRVVWAGVARESQGAIDDAASTVIRALEGLGKPDDHDFHAHVTLARVRSPVNGGSLVSFLQANGLRELGGTRITSLKLKSSTLSPSGPTYADVGEYGLS